MFIHLFLHNLHFQVDYAIVGPISFLLCNFERVFITASVLCVTVFFFSRALNLKKLHMTIFANCFFTGIFVNWLVQLGLLFFFATF